MVRQHNNIFY